MRSLLSCSVYMTSCASPASAICFNVEDATEKCRDSSLMINNKRYAKGSYDQVFLPYPQDKIYWHCGFSKKRTGWEGMAKWLFFSFSWDGTIFWGIYKCRRCTTVAMTQDRCRSASFIYLPSVTQNIYKNKFKQVVKLPGWTTSLRWRCGNSDERTAWGPSANELSINFFSDGKIEWEIKRCG